MAVPVRRQPPVPSHGVTDVSNRAYTQGKHEGRSIGVVGRFVFDSSSAYPVGCARQLPSSNRSSPHWMWSSVPPKGPSRHLSADRPHYLGDGSGGYRRCRRAGYGGSLSPLDGSTRLRNGDNDHTGGSHSAGGSFTGLVLPYDRDKPHLSARVADKMGPLGPVRCCRLDWRGG